MKNGALDGELFCKILSIGTSHIFLREYQSESLPEEEDKLLNFAQYRESVILTLYSKFEQREKYFSSDI